MPNGIDAETIFEIMDKVSGDKFVPVSFGVYVNNRVDGQRDVYARTSEDVEYVIINGEIVNRYITETVVDADNGETLSVNRVWLAESANVADAADITANAYDENGVGSDVQTASGNNAEETDSAWGAESALSEDDLPSDENYWNIWQSKAGLN